MPQGTAADQLQCVKTFIADRRRFSPVWRGETYSHDRIRIDYFSADFRNHPGAQSVVGLFEHHDKSRFEITALSYGPDDGSDLRNRIKSAAENFVDVGAMTDDEIAEFIRRREIDIVVDRTGLMQYGRFSVPSRRVAPIQVSFLGYPGTMGADWMDYIIADPTIIPENHFQFYSEQVVWLPDTYQPNDDKRHILERLPTRPECNLPEAAFVFCCFNNTYKITPEVFSVWMRLLAATEGSVLWLIETSSTATQNLRREAKARGISPERLIFAPKIPRAEHLSRHRQADLFLDTSPYNAHTTASDALWAGVPLVTCLGCTFVSRVAASLLRAVGLPELVTTSLEDYEALALKLAREPSFLAAIKAKLARNRGTHPLFDTARYARHIEAAYTTMWQRYQSGETPKAFAVEKLPGQAGDDVAEMQVTELNRSGTIGGELERQRELPARTTALQAGNLKEAERFLVAVTRAQPKHVPALNLLGVVFGRLGCNAEAIASYDRALAVAPDSIEAWYGRGMTLLAAGRPQEAIASFDRVLAVKPDFAQLHLLRAKLLADLGRRDAALAAVDKLLAAMPPSRRPGSAAAISCSRLGDTKKPYPLRSGPLP